MAEIRNYDSYTVISGTSGNDSIENGYKYSDLYFSAGGKNVTINSGAGNDTIASYKADYVSINSGSGADYVYDNSEYATIYAGEGNDTITGHYAWSSVNAGAGNDYINLYNWHKTTIKGGTGNDTIYGYNGGGDSTVATGEERKGILYEYSSGDGNDKIYEFSTKDTLSISGGSYATKKSGDDVIVTVGDGKITLVGAASLSTVNIDGFQVIIPTVTAITLNEGNSTVEVSLNSITIDGSTGDDSIENYGSYVTIKCGGGDDTVINNGSNSYIIGGTGNDTLRNYGEYATLEGGTGNDTLDNFVGHVLMNCGAGNDTVWSAYAPHSTINGGDGNDELNNYSNSSLTAINGGDGDDSVKNYGSYNTINAGSGNDYIYNQYTTNVTINMGAGSDTIYSWGGQKGTIDGGDGNDYIHIGHHVITDDNWFYGSQNLLNGGAGNDSIRNWGASATINGGSGNDSLLNYGEYSTIIGGTGNDIIYNNWDFSTNSQHRADYAWNALFKYSSGDGNDKIYGFKADSTLSIGGGSYSTTKSGDNVIVTVGDGKISLIGAASLSSVNISGTKADSSASKLIILTEGNDSYNNSVSGVTINALGGKDSIYNFGDSVSINTGAGNDSVDSRGDSVKINTGNGNDYIFNNWGGENVTISGGDGNDSVTNHEYSTNTSISGGAGNDSIKNFGSKVTIIGGKGSDTIYNNWHLYDNAPYAGNDGSNVLFKYSSGDGNDIIYGFKEDSTLSIGGGSYSTKKSGDNIIVTVGDGKITLVGATALDKVNIVGEETPIETNSWKLSGTTAKYGTASKTLVTVSGVKSINGLSISEKVVTVANSALNAKKVTISDGYTLKLGDDVSAPSTNKKWSLDDSTATYNQTKTAGYKLANNAKSISYSKKSTTTLATVKGVKSKDGLSINGKVITVAESSVNKKKITLTSDDYTLALADGLAPTTKKATWSYKSGTATYKSSYKTAGYKLASNSKSITYSAATTATTLATVKGVKSKDGLSINGKVVTVSEASVNEKKITISGDGYTLKLADGLAPTTKKAAFNLSGSTATYKSPYKTAGYKLASNSKSISYSEATTASTLATIKGAKSKTGLSVSGKKITLKNSALKNKVTVSGSYEFDFASDYKQATITGSSKADTITARGKKISVNGGKGDDTIKILGTTTTVKGGDGADVFVYNSGKNVIADYAAEDKISIASGTANISTSGNDVIFTIGSGKILTVKGGADKTVTYIENGVEKIYPEETDLEILPKNYKKSSYTFPDELLSLDASAVQRDIKITGNDFMNSIKGGAGNDSIIGGKGNDTLTGGEGADVFVWNKGDGNDLITDYNAEEDTILIKGSTVSKKTAKSDDLILTTASKNKMTIKGGAYKVIDYTDDKGSYSYSHFVSFKGNSATLKDDYGREDFNANDYSDDLAKINAKNVTHGLNIVGTGSANSIFGTAHEDTLDGGASNDTLHGGDGNDSIKGGDGKDYIYGGDGNDTLWGGKGNDYLEGGAGNNTFIYYPGEGTDTISGFRYKLDTIMIPGGYVDNISGDNGNFTIKIGSGTIILENSPGGDFARIVDENNNNLNPNRK